MAELISFTPADCSAEIQKQFVDLVLMGGEVVERTLRQNVPKARLLAFVREQGNLIGVAALKFPKESYRAKFPVKAGIAVPAEIYPYELGYIYIKESERKKGYASRLVELCVSGAEGKGILSTARTDNLGIHRILEQTGFVKTGNAYPGKTEGQFIQLFTRNPNSGE